MGHTDFRRSICQTGSKQARENPHSFYMEPKRTKDYGRPVESLLLIFVSFPSLKILGFFSLFSVLLHHGADLAGQHGFSRPNVE